MTSGSADKKQSSLKLRLISAAFLIPLTIFLILFNHWTFLFLVAAGYAVSCAEWTRMTAKVHGRLFKIPAGIIYITIAGLAYLGTWFMFPAGAWLALVVMFCLWAGDSGAYFAGRAIGGPKLAPVISPNKTWAGFWGSVICSGIVLYLCVLISPWIDQFVPARTGAENFNPILVILAGGVLGAVGQGGDLLMSLAKRRAGLKDSGGIIPGHGGLLDRIDSGLLVIPVYFLMLMAWL